MTITIFACLICAASLFTAMMLVFKGSWELTSVEKDVIIRFMALAFISFLFILINESKPELLEIIFERFNHSS